MVEMKALDYRLLWELIKDSRRSDRQLARALGTSQPTVTRKRAKLEKNLIEGYTAIPSFWKIGFELVAFTFVRSKFKGASSEERDDAVRKGREWIMKQSDVVLALSGQGMGRDGLAVSFHKSYSDFLTFKRNLDTERSDFISESQSFIAVTDPKSIMKPLHFKYLAETK